MNASCHLQLPCIRKVAHSAVTVPAAEFVMGHGRSAFLKPEKASKLVRESRGGNVVDSGLGKWGC